MELLYEISQNINRMEAFLLDKVCIEELIHVLFKKVLEIFKRLVALDDDNVLKISEHGALQVLFDFKYLCKALGNSNIEDPENREIVNVINSNILTNVQYFKPRSLVKKITFSQKSKMEWRSIITNRKFCSSPCSFLTQNLLICNCF